MDHLYNFIFNDKKVSVIVDKDNNIWFNGNNVADILEYQDSGKAIQTHVPLKNKNQLKNLVIDENLYSENKLLHPMTMYISESGLYRLIFKSKQANALDFQDWVIEKVLPEIRKTGIYKLDNKIVSNINKLVEKYRNLKNENNILLEKLKIINDPEYGIVYAKETIHNEKKFYKVGHTKYPKKRHSGYKTGRVEEESYIISYDVEKPYLCEQIIKYKLKKCQYRPNNEIFFCDLDTIKRIFKKVVDALNDNIVETYISSDSETLSDEELSDLKLDFDSLPSDDIKT